MRLFEHMEIKIFQIALNHTVNFMHYPWSTSPKKVLLL